MFGASDRLARRLLWVHGLQAFFLAVLPCVFYGVQALDGEGLYWLGVLPRTSSGVAGIFVSPLLHASWSHLLSNAFPLFALGFALWHFFPRRALWVIAISWLGAGLGIWLIGRESYHLGASGLVYGMSSYIITRGFADGRKRFAALGLVVILLYGGMVWGIFPHDPGVSWEGHFSGAFTGMVLGLLEPRGLRVAPLGFGGEETHRFSPPMHSGSPRYRIAYRWGVAVRQKD